MQSDHQLLEDGVAAYVLGAVDAGEGEAIRAHLDGCASCRQLAARLGRAVGALPLAADEVTPPARLRERILAAAAAVPPAEPQPFVRHAPPAREPGRVLRPRSWSWVPAAAAAAVLLVAGVAAGVGLGRASVPGMAGAHYALAGSGSLAGATASVVDFRGAGTTLVEFRRLPATATGKVYQLWLIPSAAGASPISAAVFTPDPDGSKVLVVGRDLSGVKVMAVTVEDGPYGAAQPTQTPELSGPIA